MVFRFSLDPVLKVKKHKEKLQKQKLAAGLQKKRKIQDVRMETQEKLESYLYSSHSSGAARIHDMQRHGRHMEQVHSLIQKLGKELDEADRVVLKEREKLAEVHKDRHLLEKVKKDELEFFKKKLEMYEQKSLDEIATQACRR